MWAQGHSGTASLRNPHTIPTLNHNAKHFIQTTYVKSGKIFILWHRFSLLVHETTGISAHGRLDIATGLESTDGPTLVSHSQTATDSTADRRHRCCHTDALSLTAPQHASGKRNRQALLGNTLRKMEAYSIELNPDPRSTRR